MRGSTGRGIQGGGALRQRFSLLDVRFIAKFAERVKVTLSWSLVVRPWSLATDERPTANDGNDISVVHTAPPT